MNGFSTSYCVKDTPQFSGLTLNLQKNVLVVHAFSVFQFFGQAITKLFECFQEVSVMCFNEGAVHGVFFLYLFF